MARKEDLANEIRSCLAGGCSASVGASGKVYGGQDSLYLINGDPIVYRAQAGRCGLTKANMLAIAEEALMAMSYYE